MTASGSRSGSAKRSAPGAATRRANSPCSAASACTVKRLAVRIRRHVSESRAAQNETSGGSSDTAANELTISPSGVPPTSAVTKATPVAKRPNASRSARSSETCRMAGAAAISAVRARGRGPGAWDSLSSVQRARRSAAQTYTQGSVVAAAAATR